MINELEKMLECYKKENFRNIKSEVLSFEVYFLCILYDKQIGEKKPIDFELAHNHPVLNELRKDKHHFDYVPDYAFIFTSSIYNVKNLKDLNKLKIENIKKTMNRLTNEREFKNNYKPLNQTDHGN